MALLFRLALTPLFALSGFAQTATASIDDAAVALRAESVYVEPGAEDVLEDGTVDDLRERIQAAGAPVKVAVFTQETVDAAGGADAALRALIDGTNISAAYALASPQNFRTGPSGRAAQIGTSALAAARDRGRDAVLLEFVDRVAAAGAGGAGGTGDGAGGRTRSNDDSGGGSLMPLLLIGGVAGGAFFITQSRKRNKDVAAQRQLLQGEQQDLLAELSVLADDVLRLEPEVQVHEAARQDYEAAVSRYRWLEAAIPQIDSPDDPPRIRRAMSEARFAMARAQAIVRGHEPPPPPAELTQPGRYGEPAIEVDEADEYRRPRYAGYDGGWYGGGFFGGNGLFTGLLLGQMLGGFGGFGWGGGGFGHGGHGDQGGDGGFDGGFGGGDFGGGDFGGGDFGGGDW